LQSTPVEKGSYSFAAWRLAIASPCCGNVTAFFGAEAIVQRATR
jgi:hypothetical protein